MLGVCRVCLCGRCLRSQQTTREGKQCGYNWGHWRIFRYHRSSTRSRTFVSIKLTVLSDKSVAEFVVECFLPSQSSSGYNNFQCSTSHSSTHSTPKKDVILTNVTDAVLYGNTQITWGRASTSVALINNFNNVHVYMYPWE